MAASTPCATEIGIGIGACAGVAAVVSLRARLRL